MLLILIYFVSILDYFFYFFLSFIRTISFLFFFSIFVFPPLSPSSLSWRLHLKKLHCQRHLSNIPNPPKTTSKPPMILLNRHVRSVPHTFEDSSNISIVSLSLNNQNYHSWSQSIKVAIRFKNKLGFLDGTLVRPDSSGRRALAWDCYNTMVMTWITNFIDLEIAESILWMDTAHEIWQELQDHYYQGGIFRVPDLQEEIFALRQGDSSIT